MKSSILSTLCLILSIGTLTAQKGFELIMPTNKVENSAYNKLVYVDSRLNKKDLGFVQTTMFNKYTPIVDEKPLADQFNTLFETIIDNTAQDRTMLLQLRELRFREETRSTSERGYCNIRISLYEKIENQYHFINTIDTIVMVKAADVTGKLLKEASNVIATLVAENLTIVPEDYSMPFSMDNIENIDAFEKNSVPLYNNEVLADGLYYNFRSFADQVPSVTKLQVKKEGDELKEVKIVNPKKEGKWKNINSSNCYAVVVEGKPYIATSAGYFPIIKDNDDFFIEKAYLARQPNIGLQFGLSFGFGMIGAIVGGIATSGQEEMATMMLDHLNGSFIALP